MESLILSANAVMPIFLLMLVGYLLRVFGVADKKGFDTVNRLVFKVFLPTMLFNNIYNTELVQVFDPRLVLFALVGVLCTFFVGYAVVFFLTSENSRRGVMLQGFFRSNYAILGLPLVEYICRGEMTGLSSLMVAFVVPTFNILAVISLERFRNGRLNVKKLLWGIAKNPLIVGCLLGVLLLASDIRLPGVIETAVGDVSRIASPLAIIVLGGSFTFSSLGGCVRELATVVAARLIVIPAVAMTLAVLMGFRGEALACLLVVFASPIAVSSYSMAQQMGGDEALAAQAVVVSSALCLVTLFGWIYVLSALGMV